MLDLKDVNYSIKDDIESILDVENKKIDGLAKETNISRGTIYEIIEKNRSTEDVYEKFYSTIYKKGYRLNLVKEEFLKEINENKVLFHGSKKGLQLISVNEGRNNCDFGKGFYLGETYEQAISFVCENSKSSVYSFTYDLTNKKVVEFTCSIEWMLAICYYRGTIRKFEENKKVLEIVKKIESADVIIAPIADNRMFYIMSLFANGDINAEVALHSLSASKLGNQFVFKTENALNSLKPCEKYYLCEDERSFYRNKLNLRTAEIETKLKLAKREFRNGLFIEELLK